MLNDTCFAVTTNSSKKKRKKLVGSGPTKKDFDQRMSVETVCSMYGSKCQALQGPDEVAEELEQLERLGQSNEDVDKFLPANETKRATKIVNRR
jgi:hypothetical protein